jgi:hypothetical protein
MANLLIPLRRRFWGRPVPFLPPNPLSSPQGLDRSVIRTAPIFTNVKNLWQGHLKLHEVKFGPQPYAHVKASMVRLPYACSIGRDSLLQTLVESDVPVKVYGTPTLRAIIKHKWRLYARRKLLIRSLIYVFYVVMFTVTGILYSMEDHTLTMSGYWKTGRGMAAFIIDGYIFAQVRMGSSDGPPEGRAWALSSGKGKGA